MEAYERFLTRVNLKIQLPSSGFRCRDHNAKIGGAANSAHLRAKAIDQPYETELQLWMMVKAAMDAGFRRIYVYPSHVHMDIDTDLPCPRFGIRGV